MAVLDSFVYVSVNEAAARARIDPKTIYRWIGAGKIPAYGIGNATRVLMSDILPRRVVQRRNGPQYAYRKNRSDPKVEIVATPGVNPPSSVIEPMDTPEG